jgi:glycosyltransferase involved in cell wall biosynthesis
VVFVKGTADAHPWYAYLAARLSGARRVFAIEQLIAEPPPEPRIASGIAERLRDRVGWRARYLFLKRLEGRLIHTTICVSEAVRRRLIEQYGYSPARTCTIYNGIDLTRFRHHGPESPPLDTVRIVCVARLNRVKRIDLLLEALRLRVSSPIRWQCTIVGGGPLEAELRGMSEQLGLSSRVHFTGQVTDVQPILEGAGLLTLPSDTEGFPLVIMEAMASGVPCVVTDVGGNREIVIHGKTGMVVPPGNAERLAEAIEFLLTHEEERKKMGIEAQRLIIERFDAEQAWRKYRQLFAS